MSLNSKPDFMIIDEGFVSFDSKNLGSVGKILKKILEKFNYIIIISHLEQLKSDMTSRYYITSKGSTSYISIPEIVEDIKEDVKDVKEDVKDETIIIKPKKKKKIDDENIQVIQTNKNNK